MTAATTKPRDGTSTCGCQSDFSLDLIELLACSSIRLSTARLIEVGSSKAGSSAI